MKYHGVEISEERVAEFCRKWKIEELSLFGSVLREDFGPESDVDCLVVFAPDAEWGLWDEVRAEQELGELLGRPVDLVEKPVVQKSENWIRRQHILGTARVVYAR